MRELQWLSVKISAFVWLLVHYKNRHGRYDFYPHKEKWLDFPLVWREFRELVRKDFNEL